MKRMDYSDSRASCPYCGHTKFYPRAYYKNATGRIKKLFGVCLPERMELICSLCYETSYMPTSEFRQRKMNPISEYLIQGIK